MSLTDEPDDIPEAGPPPESPDDHAPSTVPSLGALRWPIVQALRDLGRASGAELVEQVANSLRLTDQQRAEMVPSGQETRLQNRVNWATHELKQIGAVYYPEPGFRALTAVGNEIDDDQIKDLHYAFEAEEQQRRKAKKKGEQVLADTPTAWLIRAGRGGEHYDYNLEHGLAGLGWRSPDLRSLSGRQELEGFLRSDYPDAKAKTISTWASQMLRLLNVRVGDLVVTNGKNREISLGTVRREYRFDDDDPAWPHAVSVDWKRIGVPLSALKQDLRNSLGAQLSLCSIERNDGAWRLQQLIETGQDPGPRAGSGGESPDLADLVERFRGESEYPALDEQKRLREEWAGKLVSDNIADLSRLDLTAVASHGTWYAGTYVYPHVQGVMKWIQALDDDEYAGMLDHIRYLCWSDDEPWHRYDQLTDARSSRKTTGLGHSTTSRLLAITHPLDFLAIGVQGGKWGRAAMLRRLGLPKPAGSSYGQRVMDADRRLREHLEPHFGDDTLEMGTFLGWLLDQEPPPPGPLTLAELAGELLVGESLEDGVEFLEDIVELLDDKGQVILYGPPGTGKTYLARALAKVLAPDDSCRSLVQFHPSTSYEDFFEGYRPAGTGTDGAIRFELTRGPLARIAERASESSEQHVMIIDEINRGNLPRVLGELLFLLEYRDEEVETLYRPEEEPFSLPENLWFIGTMNTADRSIALVDAALRRRFHFVPFFPDSGPMAGLLGRWLEHEDEPAWIGVLVDAVNDELKIELGGSHLLLGPSHFMKEYGASADEQHQRLRRIWKYNIEPFIEDQFFGDPGRIGHFRFNAVMGRHGPAPEPEADASDEGDDPENAEGSEGEHAAADGDAAAEPGSTQPEDER